MKKDLGAASLVFPMPVFVLGAYNADGTANAMTAAWGGIYDTKKIGVCISRDHATTEAILRRGAFTVSMATADTAAQADYVGLVSGKEVPDKAERCGLHAVPSSRIDAPVFEEFPMTLECRFVSYNEDGWLVGEIVNVLADESILNENGKIDAALLRPITYDGAVHAYRVLGEKTADAYAAGRIFF